MAGALPPVLIELKANASEFKAKMGEAREEVAKFEAEGKAHIQKFAEFGKAALLGLGAAAVTVGAYGLEMADKYEQAHAKLETALKGAGASFEELSKPIGDVEKHMESLGFTNTQVEEALANLTVSTKSPEKALKDLGVAADLARFKHVDLAEASTAVGKALNGNLRPLKQLGIDLPVVSGGAEQLVMAQQTLRNATATYQTQLERLHEKHTVTKADTEALAAAKQRMEFAQSQLNVAQQSGTTILDALTQRIGGTAQQQTETFAGKMQVLRTRVEDVGKNIGMALIPIIEKLAGILTQVTGFVREHSTAFQALAAVIGVALVGAITAYIGRTVVAAAQSAVSFAQMIASGAMWVASSVADFATWVATQTASLAETGALWAMYAASWISEMAAASASFLAEQAATAATWVATQTAMLASSIAGFVAWAATAIARVSAAAAVWIAENVAMAAAATAAFVAENAASLGIAAALAAIVGAIVWCATHWREVWDTIKNVIKDAWDWIKHHVDIIAALFAPAAPFIAVLILMASHWRDIWHGIQTVIQDVWSVIKPIFDAIKAACEDVGKAVSDVVGAVSKVAHIGGKIGGFISSHLPHFAAGGVVPGAVGAPQLAIVHGGETIQNPQQQQTAREDSSAVLAALLSIDARLATLPRSVVQMQRQGVA